MSDSIYIAGVGMTAFGRHAEKSVKDLTADAVTAALKDADLAVDDIGAAFFSNASQAAMEGQYMIPGQLALRTMGFQGIPIFNVENACASASTALSLAVTHLRAGVTDIALAVGAEKMISEDKAKSFKVFDGAWDVNELDNNLSQVLQLGDAIERPSDRPADAERRSVFMDIYAAWARQHMAEYGTTERHIAAVSAKNHYHSILNPLSQYQHDMTVDQILDDPMIVWPLTLPMCAPISDGAAAAIVCNEEGLKKLKSTNRAIRVLACELATGIDRDPADLSKHIGRLTAMKAYEKAGVDPSDVSVAEVHDATAFAEILQTENLGLCELGQGGWMAERGETKLGGPVPVNPSGGLESRGHPIGATGLAQVFELVTQLRGEAEARQVANANLAVAENGGGYYRAEEATACITVLSR